MQKEKIEIDYAHLDVGLIMEQIKKKIADETADAPQASGGDPGPVPALDLEAGQGKARRMLLRLMSPFKPLMKLLILPIAEENRRSVLILDHANRRLDRLEHDRHLLTERLNRMQEYTKLLHHLCHNLVVEMSKLKIEEETLKTKTRILEKDFDNLGKREKALEQEVLK
jgi:hypothetical protein